MAPLYRSPPNPHLCESHIFSLRQGGGGGCVGPSRLSLLAAGPHMPPPSSQGNICDSFYAFLDNSVVLCHPHALDRYFPLQPQVCSLIWELSYWSVYATSVRTKETAESNSLSWQVLASTDKCYCLFRSL